VQVYAYLENGRLAVSVDFDMADTSEESPFSLYGDEVPREGARGRQAGVHRRVIQDSGDDVPEEDGGMTGMRVTGQEDLDMLYGLAMDGAELYGGYVNSATGFFALVPFRGGWYVVIRKGDDISAFGYRSEDEARGHFDDLVDVLEGKGP